jgi:hypothetical protein
MNRRLPVIIILIAFAIAPAVIAAVGVWWSKSSQAYSFDVYFVRLQP